MKRSKFSLSHTRLLSCDMGELVPIQLQEILPGDSIQCSTSLLVRAAPLLAPPMHPVRVRIHHWFVPHRLVWDNWEAFITGGEDGNNSSPFPYRNPGNIAAGSLANYLGLPLGVISGTQYVSALPFRGYQLIWNEYYRDQDLQTPAVISTNNGVDASTSVTLQNVAWEKDYFTSARPWEQKGPAVTIPLTGTGAVVSNSQPPTYTGGGLTNTNLKSFNGSTGATYGNAATSTANMIVGNESGLQTTLSTASVTVNALRQSLAIQRFEEARAMYGARYPEYLRALGVRSSDARLSRPEYLGGGVQTIQFSEVVQSAADGTNPVGTLRGHGITAMRSNRFRRFFEEHGYLFTLLSVLPKSIYMNGVHRTWNRRTKYDFWQRELEFIGQQPIMNKEVYAQAATPEGTFGYIDRYDEYRRTPSFVAGEFSQSALDYWHFARKFTSEPALNSTFVSAVPPERAFAAPSQDVLYVQAHHSVQARRLVAGVATPRTF